MRGRNQQRARKQRGAHPGDGPRALVNAQTHPPPINPQITHTQRLRFVTNANSVQKNITYQNLLDCLFVAATAITGFDLFDAVKIRRIELWCLFTNEGTPVTIACSFPGAGTSLAGSGRQWSDTSMGISPCHLDIRPERASMPACWQASTNTVAFQLTVPSQTVVDIEVSFRNLDVAPVATQNPPVAATAGQFYYRGLDGLAIAATVFTPQANAVL